MKKKVPATIFLKSKDSAQTKALYSPSEWPAKYLNNFKKAEEYYKLLDIRTGQ